MRMSLSTAAAAVFCVALAATPALAQDIVVPDDYITIQEAVDNATSGQEVMVRDGSYPENVFIDKAIRVYSENGPASTSITGAASDPLPVRFGGSIFAGPGTPAHLEGFTVENTEGAATLPAGTFEAGIYIDPFTRPGMKDVWVTGNADHGIVYDCSGGYFENIWVFGNGNTNVEGGGMRAFGNTPNAPLQITASTIENNTGDEGGGLFLEALPGGCFVSFTSTSNVWRNNSATDGAGGGIYVESDPADSVSANFLFDTFDTNSATGAGGGIYVAKTAVAMTDCTLTNNTANQGGGAAVVADGVSGANLNLIRTVIQSNNAGDSGGGVYADAAFFTAIDSQLLDNQALAGGGGGFDGVTTLVGFNPPNWLLTTSTVQGNSAATDGGGIRASDGNLTVNDSTVHDNNATAGSGGGVASLAGSFTVFAGSTISDNDAGDDGGGVYIPSGGNFVNTDVTGNTALDFGGGIDFDTGFGGIQGGSVSNNIADFAGGGLYANSFALFISGATFENNQLTSGGFGGGICLDAGLDTSVSNNVIRNNKASYGGGVWFGAELANLESNTIIDNVADIDGGGAYLDYAGNNSVTLNFFGGNSATTGSGGGVYVADTNNVRVTLRNNILQENSAAVEGGNGYIATDADIWNNNVVCGSAPVAGGLYLTGTGDIDVRNTIIAMNNADGVQSDATGAVTLEYNATWTNVTAAFVAPLTAGTGGFEADPWFVGVTCDDDFTNDNHYLQPVSTLIDAGDNTAGQDSDGSDNDIGALGGNFSCFVDGDLDGDWACNDCDDSDATVNTLDVDADGVSTCDGDCDDSDVNNYPGNTEICDGQDNDCDDGTWFTGEQTDGDGDGVPGCEDCDDDDPNNFPGNPEVCDGQDNDCDGNPSLFEADSDGDTFLDCEDCNPAVSTICQDDTQCPEVCGDGIDQDCSGFADDGACGCPLGAGCDDGDPCTENDTCGNAGCAGTPIVCDDGDACTTDSCAAGSCLYVPVTCPVGETCVAGVCMAPMPDAAPDAGTTDVVADGGASDAGPDAPGLDTSGGDAMTPPDAMADGSAGDASGDAAAPDATTDAPAADTTGTPDATSDTPSSGDASVDVPTSPDAGMDATVDGGSSSELSSDVGVGSGGGGDAEGCDCESGSNGLPPAGSLVMVLAVLSLLLRRRR